MQQNQLEDVLTRQEFSLVMILTLRSDNSDLIHLLKSCFDRIKAVERKNKIDRLMFSFPWHEHYKDKVTGRRVLSEIKLIKHPHELATAILLAQSNYDVIFAPRALFTRDAKKFDIYLVRDNIILQADLKNITSTNPGTIAKRIIGGSDQASRIVIHINSGINKKDLIDGLRGGVERNRLIKDVLLFYKGKFYILPKTLILSKEIFKILKCKKGYT